MKQILLLAMLAVASVGMLRAETYEPTEIQWRADFCSNPLLLPKMFAVSGIKGGYRIDSFRLSQGHFNNIYIMFQPTGSLEPASVPDARESKFMVGSQEVVWRAHETVVEGRRVIRQEAILPNVLPRERKDGSRDFIWIRVDADSQKMLDELIPVAQSILQKAM